jgi:hypothetical protein
MKTLDQLREFFNTDLRQEILQVEAKRRAIVFKVFAMVIVFLVLMTVVVYYMIKIEASIGWIVFVLFVLPVLAGVLFFEIIGNRDFYMDFKTRVIERIVKFIDPSFTYISHKYILPQQLAESKLFKYLPKKYKGDDYVVGVLGKSTKIEFSEVVARHKAKHMGPGGKQSSEWQITFKGLFFVAQVEKAFTGQTFVVAAGDSVDTLMHGSGALPTQVPIDDQGFNQYFTVYSTDHTEAKTMLTADVVQRLVDFRSNRENPVRFSFVGHRINVAVWHEKDLFEPEIFKTLLDFGIIQEYYDDLYQAISLMEQIDKGSTIRSGKTAVA